MISLIKFLQCVDSKILLGSTLAIHFQSKSCMSWQVRELMGDMESAALLYSKAVQLLSFLLKEAPSLILNPPFSLTNSDRYRLQNYIDILNNRQGHSRSQRMALLKCQDQA